MQRIGICSAVNAKEAVTATRESGTGGRQSRNEANLYSLLQQPGGKHRDPTRATSAKFDQAINEGERISLMKGWRNRSRRLHKVRSAAQACPRERPEWPFLDVTAS